MHFTVVSALFPTDAVLYRAKEIFQLSMHGNTLYHIYLRALISSDGCIKKLWVWLIVIRSDQFSSMMILRMSRNLNSLQNPASLGQKRR